jgi:hypothetical protein
MLLLQTQERSISIAIPQSDTHLAIWQEIHRCVLHASIGPAAAPPRQNSPIVYADVNPFERAASILIQPAPIESVAISEKENWSKSSE